MCVRRLRSRSRPRPDATAAQPAAAAPAPQATGESRLQAGTEWIKNFIGNANGKDGFYPELGGVPPGSGHRLGPGFRHGLFDGRASIDASAAISWSRSNFAQATFELPHLAGDRVSVGTQAKWQDFTRVSYFGVGPESLKADHTAYALKNTDYIGFVNVTPRDWLTIGGRLGYTPHVDIERPHHTTHPATQDLFTDADTPGLAERPAFLHGDASVDVDTRDHPSRPTSGGDYRMTFSRFSDRDFNQFSFRQYEAEASQFIPILHENWVIALRARVTAADTPSGDVVPFYLLPTLGGSRSLRGYDDYRFRDRNLLLLNAEYRWTVFGALDGALFYDAGKVEPRFGDLGLTNMKTSYGVGFRFHSDDTTFFRVDIGHSTEGTRLFLSLGEMLRPGHGSILIPFIP